MIPISIGRTQFFVESYPLAVLRASTRKCTLGAELEHDEADRFAPNNYPIGAELSVLIRLITGAREVDRSSTDKSPNNQGEFHVSIHQ
jgi:hypothetical protein